MTRELIGAVVGEATLLLGMIGTFVAGMRKIAKGTRCQLRSEMLRIYYHCREVRQIRQFELENFIMLYDAYKALRGNSFIDKIKGEVLSWEVIT